MRARALPVGDNDITKVSFLFPPLSGEPPLSIDKCNGTGFYFKLSLSRSFVKTNLIGYMQISSGVTRQVRRPLGSKVYF